MTQRVSRKAKKAEAARLEQERLSKRFVREKTDSDCVIIDTKTGERFYGNRIVGKLNQYHARMEKLQILYESLVQYLKRS